jgi:hypothetical protein
MGNEKQKISVRWPVTIISDQGTLEAESRNITVRGIFVNSPKELRSISRIFQMIIHGPKKKSVLIRAKLAWANCDEKRQSRSLSGGSFFFLKVAKDDQEVLKELIADHQSAGHQSE